MKYTLCILIILLTLAATVSAETATYQQTSREKLERGFANIISAPLELVKRPCVDTANYGFPPGFIIGVYGGILDTVARASVGVFEVLTFPFPIGSGNGYGPVLNPGYIWDDWDSWPMVFQFSDDIKSRARKNRSTKD